VGSQEAVIDGISFQRHSKRRDRLNLQFLRASGLAQARLQLAVLAGNRRRALEQIDRLVSIDKLLERAADGRIEADPHALEADLADQRLAIASEKLALTSGVELPRLEPAFGAGMGTVLAPDEPVEIVEEQALKGRFGRLLLWGFGLLVLCIGVTAAAVMQL
jgi:hypothetical protein